MIPLVVDYETTMKCPIKGAEASPFWPDNEVVMGGFATLDVPTVLVAGPYLNLQPRLLIGHNIAFDLHYALKNGTITQEFLAICSIWDTALAEYILSHQTNLFPTLDETAPKYGGTIKDTRIQDEYFSNGLGADKVPHNLLKPYWEADMENTAKVFRGQWAECEKRNIIPFVLAMMKARQATIEMEHNGMMVDTVHLNALLYAASLSQTTIKHDIITYMEDNCLTLDLFSPKQLSLYLFGGTVKETKTIRDGTYKNGKPKYRKVEAPKIIPPLYDGATYSTMGGSGVWSVDDHVLRNLPSHTKSGVNDLIKNILAHREVSKQISTYYEGIKNALYPDQCIHPSINHVATITGRLSCSKPNMQNITNGDIKEVFITRWGNGKLIEVDFKQVEIIMLAFLSQDKQLIHDIKNGADMHNELFRSMNGRNMRPEERKPFKRCSFALIYGAGAKGIAEQTGIDLPNAKKFINTFYERYPGVQEWHESLGHKVAAESFNTGLKDTKTNKPVRESVVESWSGRSYYYKQYPNDWNGEVAFSPTQVKNYPVQGGATGDIIPTMLGVLYDVLRNHPKLGTTCLAINTVHDSVLFDCQEPFVSEAVQLIKTVLEESPKYISEYYNVNFDLPLNVEVSVGSNWYNMETYNG